MPIIRSVLIAAGLVTAAGSAAVAQDLPPAVEARQAQFTILGFNLGTLGGMARGDTEYDAALALAAAENIEAIASIDQALNWPQGTDDGSIQGTRALPAIWENPEDFQAKWEALAAPAAALVSAAGEGQAAIGPALGPVGQVCGACHDTYRAPR